MPDRFTAPDVERDDDTAIDCPRPLCAGALRPSVQGDTLICSGCGIQYDLGLAGWQRASRLSSRGRQRADRHRAAGLAGAHDADAVRDGGPASGSEPDDLLARTYQLAAADGTPLDLTGRELLTALANGQPFARPASVEDGEQLRREQYANLDPATRHALWSQTDDMIALLREESEG